MKKLCLILAGLFIFIIAVSVLVAVLSREGIPIGQKVALVYIEGPIVEAKSHVDELEKYRGDSSVKAVVIRVDSPGGAVAPSQEIFSEVQRLAASKSVVVSMGTVAASGGYYISAPATRIVANPGTLTGSIGVIMEIPNIQGLMDKVGVKTEIIKSGEFKDIASAFRSMSKKDREVLQGVINNVYEQFVQDVSLSRSIPLEDVRGLADGRIYTGSQAVQAGLVDELGGLEDAIRVAGELGGIEGRPHVVTREKEKGLLDFLSGTLSGGVARVFPHIRLQYMMSP
ncbi:MAG: signal peptide peptidase SppA [Nitrospirota bacterium]